jgi:integrase
MTWVPGRKGWMKWYRGRNYSVSCRQLGTEPTKEASWQAANEWWLEKEAELRGRAAVPEKPLDPASRSVKDLLERFPHDELRRIAVRGEAARTVLDILEKASVHGLPQGEGPFPRLAPLPIARNAIAKLEQGESIPGEVISEVMSHGANKNLAPEYQQQYVKYLDHVIDANPVPKDRTIKGQMDGWARLQHSRHVAGKISAGRYDAYLRNVGVFVEWAGPSTDIATLDAPKIRAYYDWLCQRIGDKRFSTAYARSLLNAAKNFVSRVAELGLIPLPGNLRSKDFTFDDTSGDIDYFTVAEIRTLLGECDRISPRTKLFLLLMLNCGMYQSDISDLKPSEVDLERGVITRRRSKRKRQGLRVTYKLWPETLALLRSFGSTEGERVLVSEDGNPLVSYKTVQGKLRRYDLIGHSFERVRKKVGVSKPIKVFRKTSAHILDRHRVYRAFCPYFLAHAPKTVTEISYVGTPPEELFFEAIDWLRQELQIGG